MRTEDIFGVSFIGVLIPATVIAISGCRTTLTPNQRALWQGLGFGLIGAAVLAFGLANFCLIHNSPQPVVEGNLWDIRDPFGSGTETNSFMITDSAGRAIQIRCRYRGPGLLQGERARVRYVAYNSKLIEMDMLSGPFQTWHLRESSGELGYLWWVAIGAICIFFAHRQLAKMSDCQRTAL